LSIQQYTYFARTTFEADESTPGSLPLLAP
jgi:hypothetical protein